MKKILLVIAATLALSISAFAQREFVPYATLGVSSRVDGFFDNIAHPGAVVAAGFRNYNQDAFVSFTYGAEVFTNITPLSEGVLFGAYAIPQIGVAIGPSVFKVHLYSGFMMGYNNEIKSMSIGLKNGLSFDISDHITLDFSTYYPFTATWISAINFIWRF
ncbi:MAG: hypothetical protein J6Y45_07915 [Bacteroidales bacterium]|nr:hypothetical protein [Bacteroidales bacterium]